MEMIKERDEFINNRLEKFLEEVCEYEEIGSLSILLREADLTKEDLELFCDMVFSVAEEMGKIYTNNVYEDLLPYRVVYVQYDDVIIEVFEHVGLNFKSVAALSEDDIKKYGVDDEKIGLKIKRKVDD